MIDSRGQELSRGDKVIFTYESVTFNSPEGLHTYIGKYTNLAVLELQEGTGFDDRRGLVLDCGMSENDIKGPVYRTFYNSIIKVS